MAISRLCRIAKIGDEKVLAIHHDLTHLWAVTQRHVYEKHPQKWVPHGDPVPAGSIIGLTRNAGAGATDLTIGVVYPDGVKYLSAGGDWKPIGGP